MLQSVVSSETETVLSPIIVVWHVVHKNPVLGKPEMSVMTKKIGRYLCISNVYSIFILKGFIVLISYTIYIFILQLVSWFILQNNH